jgi:hypothetical protein
MTDEPCPRCDRLTALYGEPIKCLVDGCALPCKHLERVDVNWHFQRHDMQGERPMDNNAPGAEQIDPRTLGRGDLVLIVSTVAGGVVETAEGEVNDGGQWGLSLGDGRASYTFDLAAPGSERKWYLLSRAELSHVAGGVEYADPNTLDVGDRVSLAGVEGKVIAQWTLGFRVRFADRWEFDFNPTDALAAAMLLLPVPEEQK